MDTIAQIVTQDTEPAPEGGPGRKRIKKQVASGRRISIEDADMRHGRKSSAKTFNGFKEHFVLALDSPVTREVVVRPANEPEHEAVESHVERAFPTLREDWTPTGAHLQKWHLCSVLCSGAVLVPGHGMRIARGDHEEHDQPMPHGYAFQGAAYAGLVHINQDVRQEREHGTCNDNQGTQKPCYD
jgi:hypothetical protein